MSEIYRILLVEDNDHLQRMANKVLRSVGHDVRVAGDGPTAIKMAEAPDLDIILMDISIPEIDGLECSRRIKAVRPHIPIVALTAHAMQADKDAALAAGCDGFLSKPYELDDLKACVIKYAIPAEKQGK